MIRVVVDLKDVERKLGGLKRQLPFAVSTSINETLKLAQAAQRARNRRAFNVKNPRFVDQSVKISPFATRARLSGVILIDPPGGLARSSILTQHEEGGTKTPRGRSLWLPEPRGQTPTRKITKSTGGVAAGSGWRPRELDLTPHGSSGRVWKGNNRTFLIRTGSGEGVVLQRTGQGRTRASSLRTQRATWRGRRSGVRILYALTPRGRLAPRLRFYETVLFVIRRQWPHEFRRALLGALATAR